MQKESVSVMGAFARDFCPDDLVECLLISPGRIGDELVGRARAIEIWKSLLRSRSCTSTVIEVPHPIDGCRIVGFGVDACVSREFAEAEICNPRPGLNSRIIASIHSGRSVVLTGAELRSANSEDGLDLVMLYGSWRSSLSRDGKSEVIVQLASRFLQNRSGYRVHQGIVESVDADEARFLEATHIWRVLHRFDEAQGGRALWRMRREDALAVPGSFITPLFHYKEPVFRLRDPDQELLLAALSGLTDEELSCKLGLSLTGVKKRWTSVFERTIDLRPNLFPGLDGSAPDGNDRHKRGRQKRHHVLAYVRSHPEELRPTDGQTARPS
jgi:hypothetical protein